MLHRAASLGACRLAAACNVHTRLAAASAHAFAAPVAAVPLTVRSGATFVRSIATGASSTDRTKGARAKRQGASDNATTSEVIDVEAESVDAAEVTAAKQAAREAKKAKKASSAAQAEADAKQARREARARQKAASLRSDAKYQTEVIEKEVPLMDVTGIRPEQNMYTNVLTYMEEQKFPAEIISDMRQIGDYATGSTAEILSGRIANLCEKFGRKPYDTGSPEVQIAIMTERLKGYDRHMVEHRSDINSRRGFLATWHRRRKLLKYLRRTKYETYAFIMKELGLREADIDSVGLDRTSGTQAARIKKD